jgi:hypothetical protein
MHHRRIVNDGVSMAVSLDHRISVSDIHLSVVDTADRLVGAYVENPDMVSSRP